MGGYKERWVKAHEISKEWVARMTTLVECWNKLDGNVGELSSWVNTKDSAAPEGKSEISIEKLETDLEAYGAGGGAPAAADAAPADAAAPAPEAESAPAEAAPAEETPAA